MRRSLLVVAAFLAACSLRPTCNPPAPNGVSAQAWEHTTGVQNDPTCTGGDDVEPNEGVNQRNELASVSCSGARAVKAKVSGDVDAFHVRGSRCDGLLRASLDEGTNVRFCIFAACRHGTAALVKTDDASADQGDAMYTPEGVRGRCRTGPGDVVVRLDCAGDGSGAPETLIDAYVLVDQRTTSACTPYAFTYRF